jgi:hypothetical protein
LALIFASVWIQSGVIHTTKDQLANAATSAQFNRQTVGVIKLKGDLPLKTRVNPTCILNKQTNAPDRAAPLYKCC